VSDLEAIRYPLTLYYDASCPLCAAEMAALKRCDTHGRIELVDCSMPGFTDPHCDAAGVETAAMMRRLHCRDGAGRWRIGVPAFAIAYSAVGAAGIGAFFADARWAPLLARLYGWLADHRQGFSRLGLNGLFGAWVHFMARRAQRRAKACADGACAL
jgi:predicted DCC family thiol-disulfide oxidoreductase YuxK